MATRPEKERYPLATQEGNYIPLEIAEALGYVAIAFNDSASTPVDFPEDTEIISLLCDFPCIISFGALVPALTDSVWALNTYHIPKNTVAFIHVPEDLRSLSVIRDGADNGTLKINALRNWRALKQNVGPRSY